MKCLLFLLLAFPLQAQIIFNIGGGILVSDSLKQTSPTSADTIHYIPLNFDYSWMNITAIDTGSTFTDSVVVEYATYNYILKTGTTRRFKISDTTWTDVQFMKDSVWSDVDIMANAGANTGYKIFVGDYHLIRIRMTNAEVVADRVWFYKTLLVEK